MKPSRPGPTVEATHLEVRIRPGETADSLIRRFTKAVRKSDVMLRLRQKSHFRTRSSARRMKHEITKHLSRR